MLEEDTARPSDLSGVVPWERERMGGGCVLGGEGDGQERKGAGGGRNREGEDYVTDNSRRPVCGACMRARAFFVCKGSPLFTRGLTRAWSLPLSHSSSSIL